MRGYVPSETYRMERNERAIAVLRDVLLILDDPDAWSPHAFYRDRDGAIRSAHDDKWRPGLKATLVGAILAAQRRLGADRDYRPRRDIEFTLARRCGLELYIPSLEAYEESPDVQWSDVVELVEATIDDIESDRAHRWKWKPVPPNKDLLADADLDRSLPGA